ncbi:MAG: tRNA (N6-threonylcarbamoyladenosine(37)-N6)-methyltransferase TrmO [Bacteroidetes bacterium]|nr:tRNA (N6-threonylcarbamoyladenosine(37)-N6)-methyltransferase TrmO [Bacteroidota bacterium]MBU1423474.1 tRNA (N6-threonylcarbamoyladenosine(37)-N6)-methyltransferase TrmO [Bacteroidota bacterium]MBU2636412.1 tRNA (N6-threonylcarbamoyladenosine(37)-N6)-methyltransferase TrmO [Bacteroidota bacterium]
MRNKICFKPIGIIHSPFTEISGVPIQPLSAKGIKGTIELNPEFTEGLKDIEGFSHITLIYYFHLISKFSLQVVPFMDNESHGIFATRSPSRPNAIGISTVRLISVDQNILHIEEVDMIDGTPLLDIKPFYPRFDNRTTDKVGWLTGKENIYGIRSDERFK